MFSVSGAQSLGAEGPGTGGSEVHNWVLLPVRGPGSVGRETGREKSTGAVGLEGGASVSRMGRNQRQIQGFRLGRAWRPQWIISGGSWILNPFSEVDYRRELGIVGGDLQPRHPLASSAWGRLL